MTQKLVPEAKNGLAKFRNQVASEMGVPFSDYNGDLIHLFNFSSCDIHRYGIPYDSHQQFVRIYSQVLQRLRSLKLRHL